MRETRHLRTTRLVKLAAGVLIGAVLVATGWTAEKVYQRLAKGEYHVEVGDGWHTYVPADAPEGSVDKAKRQHEEIKQLIAEKKYELVKTFEAGGETQYVYRFTLADGSHRGMNFAIPLENVASMEDYLQKREEQSKQRKEEISKAVAAGRFRLVDLEPISVHICRDADSNEKLQVQRWDAPDGKDQALVRPEGAGVTRHKTSWQDHLEAVRQGKRVLLDLQITTNYTYEITFDDGSTTLFNYGGGPDSSLDKLTAEDVARMLGQRPTAAEDKDR